MYAVIRTGGKQYRVEPGHHLLVEKIMADPGKTVELNDVLLFGDDQLLDIGKPVLPMTVHCICVGHEKGPKLRTIKYRRRKNYRRTYGHRQWYTRLLIQRFEKRG